MYNAVQSILFTRLLKHWQNIILDQCLTEEDFEKMVYKLAIFVLFIYMRFEILLTAKRNLLVVNTVKLSEIFTD